jgi:hypothetical protein
MKLFFGIFVASLVLVAGPAATAAGLTRAGAAEMLVPASTTQHQCVDGGRSALLGAGLTATSGPIGAHGHNDTFLAFILCDRMYSRQVFVVVSGDTDTDAMTSRIKANLVRAIPGTIDAP